MPEVELPNWANSCLHNFFSGKSDYRQSILLTSLPGTDFQKRVWSNLLDIPFASTISYRELATRTGHTNAQRATGNAVGRNPLPFLIPCHRVILANGSIGNYGGGKDLKRKLLHWEQNFKFL